MPRQQIESGTHVLLLQGLLLMSMHTGIVRGSSASSISRAIASAGKLTSSKPLPIAFE